MTTKNLPEPYQWSATLTNGTFLIQLPNPFEMKDEELVRGITHLFLKGLHRFVKKPEKFPEFVALRSGCYSTESIGDTWEIRMEIGGSFPEIVAKSLDGRSWADGVNFIAPQI